MNILSPEAVRKLIEQAFANTKYPGDNLIVDEKMLGPIGTRSEYNYVYEYFLKKKWEEILVEDFISEYKGPLNASLSFMSPAAFLYYLPAYMIMCLHKSDIEGVSNRILMIEENLVFSLCPPDPSSQGKNETFFRLTHALTDKQKHAVAIFLDLMKSWHASSDFSGDIRDENYALKKYWYQFLKMPTGVDATVCSRFQIC